MNRLLSVLLWSVIAAAFIGPGTVTAAASAGAAHGTALLWALAFSVFATFILQEAAGRLTLVSGRELAEALAARAGGGLRAAAMTVLVLGAILLGNAAYEAGNILGGVAGARLASDLPEWQITLAIGGLAAMLLAFGSPRRVALLLGSLVALMGIAFIATAAALAPSVAQIFEGLAVPRIPAGAGLGVLALIGTTVVPYNLFLGSGLARGQSVGEMRFGLAVAIIVGGFVSGAILIVGTALDGEMDFPALAAVLQARLGDWAVLLLGVGLFAAGLSSAVTAPLAAAITARGLFGGKRPQAWEAKGWRFRAVWGGVLAVGLLSGLSGVRPIPAILAAQAFNALLLPLVAIFLWRSVNDAALMGERTASRRGNIAIGLVVLVTILLGASGLARAGSAALGLGG